jgi:hypothetical protein
MLARDRVEHVQTDRQHLLADAVAGDGGDRVALHGQDSSRCGSAAASKASGCSSGM